MRTLIKPNELRKRFIIIIVLLLTALAAAGSLIGCGDDINGNNGNGNPPASEQLIYFQDSLVLVTPPFANDTDIFVNNVENIKITFTGETNADSVNGWSLFSIDIIDITNNVVVYDTTYNRTLHMNNNFDFRVYGITGNIGVNIRIQCLRNPPHVFFMKLRNIKIYKIN